MFWYNLEQAARLVADPILRRLVLSHELAHRAHGGHSALLDALGIRTAFDLHLFSLANTHAPSGQKED